MREPKSNHTRTHRQHARQDKQQPVANNIARRQPRTTCQEATAAPQGPSKHALLGLVDLRGERVQQLRHETQPDHAHEPEQREHGFKL